jgi:adenylosuccinate lyase
MDAVKAGGNRQKLHNSIRFYLIEAGSHVKDNGLTSNLVDLIAANPNFKLDRE